MGYPAKILIIRHAEKTKVKSDENLSVKGYERAAALAYYFPDKFPDTNHIIAAGIGKHSPSHRPVETITPTAKRLKIKIRSKFLKPDFDKMVEYVLSKKRYTDKQLIICWEHTDIEGIAIAFGTENVPTTPWPEDRYDLVWELNYNEKQSYELVQHPQLLLYGDQDSIIANSDS